MTVRHRKSNRLSKYDYSSPGYYFLTVCTKARACCLGEVINGEMILNNYGKIVDQQWLWLKQQYPHIDLDEYIVMPNHLHGILIIASVGTGLDLSLHKPLPLSNIVGAFKTTSSKSIHLNNLPGFSWQRSYYDHVIRKDESLDKIREYIRNNPLKWELDRNNPENLWM